MEDSITSELYFLIAKFLENGPCDGAFKKLIEELDRNDLLPARYDWTGTKHKQSFQELKSKFRHIGSNHLLDISNRIIPLLDSEFKKSIKYVPSLLGDGNGSVLRIKEIERKYYTVRDYLVRRHGIPPPEPLAFRRHHIVKALYGRETCGPFNRRHVLAGAPYKNLQLLGRTQGHLSAVYCVLFDSSGKYIFTGADDLLVKVWHAISGRLLSTLRGASAEITDLAVNYENTLLAAGSVDKMIRVWCLQTAFPVATLVIHTGMITGVNFCPAVVNGCRYLASTATDGSVAFWKYATNDTETSFEQSPVQFLERMRPGCAQILCGSFSPGGMFLATGSADHHVRVYKMAGPDGPQRILENAVHTERVDSIQWAHTRLRFASGSKDGTCLIWYYEQQSWKYICLSMKGSRETEDDSKVKLRVTMLTWDKSDQWVITACSDHSIKVWDSFTGVLAQTLIGHKDETYVLESHPLDSKIIMSAGHDGKIFLWNIITGEYYASFQNTIDGQGCGGVFDAKWSPDGASIAATDSHGQILVYGLGMPDVTRKVPPAVFFHTDYRPLTRDLNNQVLDEQTQMPPHLMPPPFLVDMDGNPYPPYLQRLVPGREHCDIDQLVPNVVLSDEGHHEVIMEADDNEFLFGAELGETSRRSTSNLRSRVGMRRTGDVEGVRQSSGNWQRGDISWTKRVICEPLDKHRTNEISQRIQYMASIETEEYKKEAKKPKPPEPEPEEIPHKRVARRKKAHHTYRTRASRTEQLEMELENGDVSSADSQDENDFTAHESNLDSSSSSSENDASSDYSDWTADHGMNKLEPPKRVARVRNVRRATKIKKIVAGNNSTKKPILSEVPEEYRPSEWLAETVPKKAPYYPQMGDEVMFFQQGYNLYLDAVQSKNIYKVRPAQLNPWGKIKLKEPQLCKVIYIKYEIRPPRLCGLRLNVMTEDNKLTGQSFDLKYHDISDVIDFLVLRQSYDTAMSRNWKLNDRFRAAIDDAWWFGKIINRNKNAQSPFLCYRIRWDNSEDENLSPWDLEPLNSRREPPKGSSYPVSPSEMKNILYHPNAYEWPGGDRDTACERILRGLDDLMSMSIAEHFLAPVDISMYPTYAYHVEYPIDLSTIKARFENRFYRRLASAQFDVRYIASNAEKFNERGSNIVKHARVITDILLKIIKATLPLDVPALCRQIQENYVSTDSTEGEVDAEIEATMLPGPSNRPRLRPAVSKRNSRNLRLTRDRRARGPRQPFDWKHSCKELLHLLWMSEDSEPFRQPVDRLEHPDYDKIIDTPMDLSIIREELKGDNYDSPHEFWKDLKIMFNNAKNYTPNKKSRIYAMTVRLSNLAEEQMKTVLSNHRNVTNRKTTADSSPEPRPRRSLKRKREESSSDEGTSDDTNQPSTSTGIGRRSSRMRVEKNSPRKVAPGRSPRKIKTPVKALSTSESEEEKHDTSRDSSHSQRKLRARKQWNYARMLASDSDNSDAASEKQEGQASRRPRRKMSVASNEERNAVPAHRLRRNLQTRHYNENTESSEEEDDDGDVNIRVSVSSRGRIRRLTAKARASVFRE